jgi:hypothetical protein
MPVQVTLSLEPMALLQVYVSYTLLLYCAHACTTVHLLITKFERLVLKRNKFDLFICFFGYNMETIRLLESYGLNDLWSYGIVLRPGAFCKWPGLCVEPPGPIRCVQIYLPESQSSGLGSKTSHSNVSAMSLEQCLHKLSGWNCSVVCPCWAGCCQVITSARLLSATVQMQ